MSSHGHRVNTTQLIFVKNVPQESASTVASLYTQYKPLGVKNLYAGSRITTLMITLPTADVAVIALHRTEGMRVDSTVISVERYNAKQSIVARRVTRRGRNSRADNAHDDGYEADGWEEGEEEHTWEEKEEGEEETDTAKGFVPVKSEASRPDGVSWADVTRGKAVVPETPSPSTTTQALHTPDLTPGSPTPSQADSVPPMTPNIIIIRPATLVPKSLGHGQQTMSANTLSSQGFYTAMPSPQKMHKSSKGNSEGGSSQTTQVPNTPQQQRESLSRPVDSAEYIRNRHCANCSFCQMRVRRQ